jgi:hypothetical protein
MKPVLVRPCHLASTTLGGFLLVATMLGGLAVLFLIDAAMRLAGRPLQFEPPALRLAVVIVAAAPTVALLLEPALWRIPRLGPAIAALRGGAVIDEDGIEVSGRGTGTRRFRWDDIGGLAVHRGGLRDPAELLALDGTVLAALPESLAYPRRQQSLAEIVVNARPDRYVLSGANAFGRPDEFRLKGAGAPLDVAAVTRRRRQVIAVLWILLLLLAVVGTALLIRAP